MESCLYEGHVRHRRFVPVRNEFRYALYMMLLDLEELPRVFSAHRSWSYERPNLACFRRRDYLGDPAVPLDRAVRDRVEAETGRRPRGPIRLLTHVRTFGYLFNPVSFYYCYSTAGRRVETIVAEITNTPWNERHSYVLAGQGVRRHKRFRFEKSFHVSPFMDMDMDYDWRFSEPGDSLNVHMIVGREGRAHFTATLTLRRREITARRLSRVLVRYPFMTFKVTAFIHWQAFRLWRKGATLYTHPAKRGGGSPGGGGEP